MSTAVGVEGESGSPSWLRGIRAAVTVLTRVPVGGFPYSDADWRWSAAYLPLVGTMLGAVLSGVWILTVRAGFLVAAVMAVGVSLFITGAMHEDGLADTADALGGGMSRERVLAILKDSRIGAFGAAALTITLILRVALLERLGALAPIALVFTHGAARLTPVWLMATLPYVTDISVAKSRSIVAAGPVQVAIATGWVLAVGTALCWMDALNMFEVVSALAAAATIGMFCAFRFQARVGGITGDFLGAAEQLSECAMLLTLAIVRGGPP